MRSLMPMVAVVAVVGVPAASAKNHPAKTAATGGAGTASSPAGPSPCPGTSGTPTTPSGTATTPTGTGTTPTGTGTTPTGPAPTSGGAGLGGPTPTPCTPQDPTVPGFVAKIVNGLAYAPADAPSAVQRAIWAGDRIRTDPYVWGGGHGSFNSNGYDCSGAVSYVLHAAGLLKTPEDSGELMSWGQSGTGEWITVYSDPAHAFIEIAGIRFDTSTEDDPNPPPGSGPRWRPLYPNPPRFTVRHPLGY